MTSTVNRLWLALSVALAARDFDAYGKVYRALRACGAVSGRAR